MNVIVVFEDPASKQSHEGKPYTFASTLDVRCPCGNFIHPIPGAWCTQCEAKVVEIRYGAGGREGSTALGRARDIYSEPR
jgi:hypothetical protein